MLVAPMDLEEASIAFDAKWILHQLTFWQGSIVPLCRGQGPSVIWILPMWARLQWRVVPRPAVVRPDDRYARNPPRRTAIMAATIPVLRVTRVVALRFVNPMAGDDCSVVGPRLRIHETMPFLERERSRFGGVSSRLWRHTFFVDLATLAKQYGQ